MGYKTLATTTIMRKITGNVTVSLPAADDSSNSLAIVCAAVFGGLFMTLLFVLVVYWLVKRNAQAKAPLEPHECDLEGVHSIPSPGLPLVIVKPPWWTSWPT